MLIEIADLIFKCEEDKNIFISRLHDISSFESFVAKERYLYLSLSRNTKEEHINELQAICNIWGANFKIINQPYIQT